MVVPKRSIHYPLTEKEVHRLKGFLKEGMKKVALKPESGKYLLSVRIHASSPLTDRALIGACKDGCLLHSNKGGTAITRPLPEFPVKGFFAQISRVINKKKGRENMSKELAKTYDPHGLEDRIYQKWLDKKYFHAEVDRSKKPFTIVIPPPNITGQLHMGHALDNTMQDILIRFKRMQGYNALWQPGTDHASIATEVKIIEKLKEEGIDKHDLGREKFLERA